MTLTKNNKMTNTVNNTMNTHSHPQKRIVSLTLLALATSLAVSVQAAPVGNQPDAGTTLRDLTPITTLPAASPVINLQAPAVSADASGGAMITVQSISFTGNTQYSSATLNALLADAIGKPYDLAGLQALTNRITAHYRNHGFAFARALLPVQPMTDGALVIEMIEGRYGSVKAVGADTVTAKQVASAQVFLTPLHTGEIIQSAALERAVLILADQPGFKASPLLRPGQTVGTGDLDMDLERSARYNGEVGLDNYGNRYTGRTRAHLDLNLNSPFLFGDQLKFNTLYSEENLWLGAINYSLPIGGSGLRANAGYAHTYYELGQEFASSKVYGTAKVSSAGLSYPIIRSQQMNLSVAATYQHKALNNRNDITPSSNTNSSDSLPISLNFDRRDQLGGGGMTYGSVSWTPGDLTVASANRALDSTTAKTAGGFNKVNLDLTRLQALPANFTLLGRVSAQVAGSNLDSSEKFSLGGVNGVRAYPSGEAYGDEGVLAQLEVRYAMTSASNQLINSLSPYAFYDIGTLSTNHSSFTAGNNQRSLAGVGVGVRFDMTHWSVDGSAAWRTTGAFSDKNQADTPTAWVSAKYKF